MFSILMPIYNGVEFIDESVNSVINQSFKEWELLILINGHPQNSDVYKKALEFNDKRIKVLDLFEIKGKSNALNCAINECKYGKLCLLDVDDIWLINKLKNQLNYINQYDIVGTNCKYFGERNDVPYIPLGEINKDIFRIINPIINSSSCFNKSDAGWLAEYDSVEDYEMWLRLAKENKTFFNISTINVLHRIHKKSAFNTSQKQENLKNIILKKYYNI